MDASAQQNLFCSECGSPKESRFCGKCQKETPNLIKIFISETVKARESIGLKQKRPGFRRFVRRIFQGWRPSKDPRLSEGIDAEIVIDKEKNEYHQIIRDARTGEILHQEHEPLTEHKAKDKG